MEYSGEKSFYEVDSSSVPAEWHLWLHGTVLEPPASRTSVGASARLAPVANSHGSSAPYTRNVGGVIAPHKPNMSSYRPRGYGLGNGLTGACVVLCANARDGRRAQSAYTACLVCALPPARRRQRAR